MPPRLAKSRLSLAHDVGNRAHDIMRDRLPLDLLEDGNEGDGDVGEHEDREGEQILDLIGILRVDVIPLGDRRKRAKHEHDDREAQEAAGKGEHRGNDGRACLGIGCLLYTSRRIHHVKTPALVKETLSDEDLETLRDGCRCDRDLAIIDMLASTGMRVGELVRLDRADLDLHERECLVLGKGNKQRPVYFDARTKLHLKNYLASRTDDNPALFVSLSGRRERLSISGVELRLRQLGRRLLPQRVHPHKFRRTLATNAIDKGMPVEQVQKLLGHARIDTTMHYAMVNQNNVKASHRRYLE